LSDTLSQKGLKPAKPAYHIILASSVNSQHL